MKKILLVMFTALFLVSCSTPSNTDTGSYEEPEITTPTTTPTATTPEEEEPVVTPEPSEEPEIKEPEPVEEPTELEDPQNSETDEPEEDSVWQLVEKDDTTDAGIEYFLCTEEQFSYSIDCLIENQTIKLELVGTKNFTTEIYGYDIEGYYLGREDDKKETVKCYKVFINKNVTEKVVLDNEHEWYCWNKKNYKYCFEINNGKMKCIAPTTGKNCVDAAFLFETFYY